MEVCEVYLFGSGSGSDGLSGIRIKKFNRFPPSVCSFMG